MATIYASVPDAPEVKDTFLSPLESADNEMTGLLSRIEEVADRLCGSAPSAQGANSSNIRGIPNGAFETVADRGGSIRSKIDAAHQHIDRITRALP